MKCLVNAITCTRFVFALILVLAAPGSEWFWAAYGLGALYAAGAVLLIRSVTYAAGFYKFRTFVSLYTTFNRAAGVVLVGYPVLAVLLGQGTAAWLAAAAAGLSALEELVLVLRAWTPDPDVRGLLWIEKPRR